MLADGIMKPSKDWNRLRPTGVPKKWKIMDKFYKNLINKYAISSKEKRKRHPKKTWHKCADNYMLANLSNWIDLNYQQTLSPKTLRMLKKQRRDINAKVKVNQLALKDAMPLLGMLKSKEELECQSLSVRLKFEFADYFLQ
jgi:hypothetical protein